MPGTVPFFAFPPDQDPESDCHLDFQPGFAAGADEDTHMEEDAAPASIPDSPNWLRHSWVMDYYVGTSEVHGGGETFLAQFNKDQYSAHCLTNIYYPFANSDNWELANFLLKSGLSMHAINKYLSLGVICRPCFI